MWRLLLLVVVAIGCGGSKRGERAAPGRQVVIVEIGARGHDAEAVEQLALVPIERALAGAREVGKTEATATAGQGRLVAEVAPGTEPATARSAIVERLARADLPDGVDVQVLPPAVGAPVTFTLASDRLTLVELRSILDDVVRPALRAVEGVVEVVGCGGAEDRLELAVDPARLAAYGLTTDDVAAALSRVSDRPAGMVDATGGDFVVRAGAGRVEEIGAATVKLRADGTVVRIADVAEVRRGAQPMPCPGAGDAGIVRGTAHLSAPATAAVTARLEELTATLPEGTRLRVDTAGPAAPRIVEVRGPDREVLVAVAQRLRELLGGIAGVERAVVVGDARGPSPAATGIEIAVLREGARAIPVVLRSAVEPEEGYVTLLRASGSPCLHVEVTLAPGAEPELRSALAGVELPPGVQAELR